MTDSPSLVPDIDADRVAALKLAVAIVPELIEFDGELQKYFVVDEDNPLFVSVPGLLGLTRKIAHATTQARSQGRRSISRGQNYDDDCIARARHYLECRASLKHMNRTDDELKEWCGKHPPLDPHPADPTKPDLKTLKPRRFAAALNRGEALLSTNMFVVHASRNVATKLY